MTPDAWSKLHAQPDDLLPRKHQSAHSPAASCSQKHACGFVLFFFFCEPKRIYIAHGSTVQTIFIRNTLENKKLQSNHFQGHEKTPDSAAVHRNSNLGRRGIGR
jgi:hypothetical protein